MVKLCLSKMKALVLKEYKKFAIEDFAVPALQPDEVLVRVRACGICGSDVHGMDWKFGPPDSTADHGACEASGQIAEVGSGVTGWKAGDETRKLPQIAISGQKVAQRQMYAGSVWLEPYCFGILFFSFCSLSRFNVAFRHHLMRSSGPSVGIQQLLNGIS